MRSAVIKVYHTSAESADSEGRDSMGNIAAQYGLMPESTDVDLQGVIDAIPKVLPGGVKIVDTRIEPIAFGLKKIVLGIIIDDSDESIGTVLEDALIGLSGIDNIECISSALL